MPVVIEERRQVRRSNLRPLAVAFGLLLAIPIRLLSVSFFTPVDIRAAGHGIVIGRVDLANSQYPNIPGGTITFLTNPNRPTEAYVIAAW